MGSRRSRSTENCLECVSANRSADSDSLVVRLDFDDRAELLAAAPMFIT
jgi:hypothetical protein